MTGIRDIEDDVYGLLAMEVCGGFDLVMKLFVEVVCHDGIATFSVPTLFFFVVLDLDLEAFAFH